MVKHKLQNACCLGKLLFPPVGCSQSGGNRGGHSEYFSILTSTFHRRVLHNHLIIVPSHSSGSFFFLPISQITVTYADRIKGIYFGGHFLVNSGASFIDLNQLNVVRNQICCWRVALCSWWVCGRSHCCPCSSPWICAWVCPEGSPGPCGRSQGEGLKPESHTGFWSCLSTAVWLPEVLHFERNHSRATI